MFLDLKKDFDFVNHETILNKLQLYNFSYIALEYSKPYPTKIQHFIYVGNVHSSNMTIKCGVPQGYFKDPLLFILYINDISFSIDLYAND